MQKRKEFYQIGDLYLFFFLNLFLSLVFRTFADLAVPVFVRGTVRIIPVPPIVSIDFSAVLSIVVIIWLAHTPVFKFRLHKSK